MELLSAALAPLLEHLQAWLAHGLVNDPCREFCIVAGTSDDSRCHACHSQPVVH